MWDMRPAENDIENRFAQTFLDLDQDELRLLFGTCHDVAFQEKHSKLVSYLYKALLYRENQIKQNMDACSIQDLFIEKWAPEEIANGIVGLERLRVLAEKYPKILEYIHMFDRVLVTRCLGLWLADEDLKNAG